MATPTIRSVESAVAIRKAETQSALDAITGLEGHVLKFGERQAPGPIPRITQDLPIPCPACNLRLLTGVLYHVFVDDRGLMVWCEGLCPGCQSTQKVIWMPLCPLSDAAQAKAGDEFEVLVRDWVEQLKTPVEKGAAA